MAATGALPVFFASKRTSTNLLPSVALRERLPRLSGIEDVVRAESTLTESETFARGRRAVMALSLGAAVSLARGVLPSPTSHAVSVAPFAPFAVVVVAVLVVPAVEPGEFFLLPPQPVAVRASAATATAMGGTRRRRIDRAPFRSASQSGWPAAAGNVSATLLRASRGMLPFQFATGGNYS